MGVTNQQRIETFPKDSFAFLTAISIIFTGCMASLNTYDWTGNEHAKFVLLSVAICCGISLGINIMMMAIIMAKKHYYEIQVAQAKPKNKKRKTP